MRVTFCLRNMSWKGARHQASCCHRLDMRLSVNTMFAPQHLHSTRAYPNCLHCMHTWLWTWCFTVQIHCIICNNLNKWPVIKEPPVCHICNNLNKWPVIYAVTWTSDLLWGNPQYVIYAIIWTSDLWNLQYVIYAITRTSDLLLGNLQYVIHAITWTSDLLLGNLLRQDEIWSVQSLHAVAYHGCAQLKGFTRFCCLPPAIQAHKAGVLNTNTIYKTDWTSL